MSAAISKVMVPRQGHHGGDPVASVYRASFTRTIFSSLSAVAVSNVLVFMLDVPSAFMGIASALGAFACLAGPLLFHGASRRIGIKRTMRAISAVDLSMILLVVCVPSPHVMLAVLIIDGIGNALFWANMATAVRTWQEESPPGTRKSIYRRYSVSWIGGGLTGELLGLAIIVIGFNDMVAIAISVLLAVIQVYTSHALLVPVRTSFDGDGSRNAKHSYRAEAAPKMAARTIGRLLLGPIGLMFLAELAVQMIRGTYDFLYPFIMYDEGDFTGWMYLMSMIQRVAFLMGIYASSKHGARGQHLGATMGLGIMVLLTVHVLGASGMATFTAALGISALATGVIYGYSSQVMLRHGDKREALRLASAYEAVSGLGYGIMVVVSGLAGTRDIAPVFTGLLSFLAMAFIAFSMAIIVGKHANPRARPAYPDPLPFLVLHMRQGTSLPVCLDTGACKVNDIPYVIASRNTAKK